MMNEHLTLLLRDNGELQKDMLDGLDSAWHIGESLQYLANSKWGNLPFPGSGRTLDRWRCLARVGGHDLSLAKLFEGHTDALVILQELDYADLQGAGQVWAVWCAEPPGKKIKFTKAGRDGVGHIYGIKPWCSGARHVDWALLSGWNDAGDSCLLAVDMKQPTVRVSTEGWHAVGMHATVTQDVEFQGARAQQVGESCAYVGRPGFYHGSGGIAACWYGAAVSIVETVQMTLLSCPEALHGLAHLGAMDVSLAEAAGLLRTAAQDIDANPLQTCKYSITRARLSVESAAENILIRAPRAVGAGPLCKNEKFARMIADLPVFIRQSHAERDLAAHGLAATHREADQLWNL